MAVFDLTKQQVVDILADFEEKLPNNGIKFFTPSSNFNHCDPLSINVEAQRINNFLGLEGFSPIVSFEDLSKEQAAAHVNISRPYEKFYDIAFDRKSAQNNANALKTLSHEMCHKFLAIRGMQQGVLPGLDEAMTELCTIYMGLGLITLNGYNEHNGYLNLEDFCHAFCVVYKSRGMSNEEIKNIVPENSKEYAKNILHDMDELQTVSMATLVQGSQYSDYNLRRRIRLLQLILDNMPEIKEKHNLQDGMFRNRQQQLKDGKHPIQEMLLRETIVQNSLTDSRLDKCCHEIDKLISILCSTMKVDTDNVSEGLTINIPCPSCGFITPKKKEAKLQTLKCPQCHHYFAWDGQPFTFPKKTEETTHKDNESFWKRIIYSWRKKS